MAETILEPVSFRRMPWKNGGGYTTEIAAERDPGSSDMDFAWRVSIAEIRSSGPFSRFPGSDRLIMQLSGQSIELSHPGTPRPSIRLEPFKPYAFDGEWDTIAEIKPNPQEPANMPAFDFNLIIRRDYAFGALAVFSAEELRQGEFARRLLGARRAKSLRILHYAHDGEAMIGSTALPKGHAFLWTGQDILDLPPIEVAESACMITTLVGFR